MLNGVLAERSTGLRPLALTAARKSERMLAMVLGVSPAATGLMAPSLALIAGRSSGMRAGSSASKAATRFTADRRSLRRVSESKVLPSKAAMTCAKVASSTLVAPRGGIFALGLVDIR